MVVFVSRFGFVKEVNSMLFVLWSLCVFLIVVIINVFIRIMKG